METAFFAIASTHPSIFSAILSRRSSLPVVIAASLLVARGGLSQILWTRYVVVGSCFMYFFVASRTEESFCIIGIPAGITLSLSLSLFDRRTRFARPSPREGEKILSVRVCSFFDSPRSTMSMERALDDDDESGKRIDVSGRSILFFLVLYTLVLKMGDTNWLWQPGSKIPPKKTL